MGRSLFAAIGVSILLLPAAANAQWQRNPTPEGVTVFATAGGLFPVGKFSDAADGGFAPGFGGYYRLNDFIAPAFQFQYAFLQVDSQRLGGGESINALNLLGGLRLFIPVKGIVHPWVTGLLGWAHYHTSQDLPLEPLFGVGERSRNDFMLSAGGGVDFQVHPNVSLGIDTRALFSISTNTSRGQGNLTAITVSGVALFHF